MSAGPDPRRMRAEDVIAAVAAVLVPILGELFATEELVWTWLLAAVPLFWASALTVDRGKDGKPDPLAPPRNPRLLLAGLGGAAILANGGLEALETTSDTRGPLTALFAGLVVFALVQHVRTEGRAFVGLEPRFRRMLGWPYVAALGGLSSTLLSTALDPTRASSLVGSTGRRSAAETAFVLVLALGALLPLLYGVFVVAPRLLVDAREPRSFRPWAVRYAVAISSAVAGALARHGI